MQSDTIKHLVRFIVLNIFSVAIWVAILATGYGAQSLTNILEVPIVIFITNLTLYFMRKSKIYEIMLVLIMLIVVLRLFMPALPE